MRIWKRTWFWVVAAALLFLGMLAGLFLTDEPPPADQDLRGYRRTVAEEDNGFHLVDLGEDAVAWPEDEEKESLLFAWSETFDREAVRAFIAQHEALLRRIPECLSLSEFQIPEISSLADSTGHLIAWKNLAWVVEGRARLHTEEGRIKEALGDGLLLVRFGHRIEGAQGDRITALGGQVIRLIGARTIITAARRGTLPPGELRPFLTELRQFERNLEGYKDALRVEYCVSASIVDEVASGASTSLPGRAKYHFPPLLVRLLLKANQTKRMLAEQTRLLLSAVGRAGARESDLGEPPPDTPFWRALVNYPGKSMVHSDLWNRWSQLALEKHCLLYLRAAQAFLALKSFEVANGNLPPSLAALVPEYLPAVPEDPFDGQPLRYDAARRIVYSVGSDLFDAHGSAAETPSEALDDPVEPTLRL